LKNSKHQNKKQNKKYSKWKLKQKAIKDKRTKAIYVIGYYNLKTTNKNTKTSKTN